MKVSVGVDLGGTWLRACAVDEEGRVLRRAKVPAPPPADLAPALKKILARWRLPRPAALTVGSKGVWKPAPRKAMARALAPSAGRVSVFSDAEMAYTATLGERPGVLVIAGTGSMALARDEKGRRHRAGGLGPARGDEGSAYWLGKEYRLRVLGKEPLPVTPANVRKTAALARTVWSRRRDPACARLIAEAAGHLASIAASAARAAGLKAPLEAGWSGGLLREKKMREMWRRELRRKAGAARVRSSSRPMEETAARLPKL